MFDLRTIFHGLHRQLFPALTDELGELSVLDQQFCEVISLAQLGRLTGSHEGCGEGRPPCARVWLAHAFIAKHVYQFPATAALIEALRSRPTLRRRQRERRSQRTDLQPRLRHLCRRPTAPAPP